VIVRREGERLDVSVAVTNDRTGHDLPGGIALRHALLLVTAKDAAGNALEFTGPDSARVPEYGGVGAASEGNFAGLPGKGFAKIFTDGTRENVFFTEAIGIASDTRIRAGATDWSDYSFALPAGVGDIAVEAKLLYRRAFRSLVLEKNWTLTGHGKVNPDLVGPDFGVVMGEATSVAPVGTIAIDTTRAKLDDSLVLRTVSGSGAGFAAGAVVEIADAQGAWHAFSAEPRVSATGRKLVQSGKVGGLTIRRYWQNGETRYLRVTNPDGAVGIVRLVRSGTRLEPV